MRISDQERRDIAAKLRALEPWVHLGTSEPITREEVEDVLGFEYSIGDSYDAAGIRRLADLIDRPSTTRHGKFRTKYGRETPCCEVCGYSIGDLRWNHCPKCGAVIADD